MEPVILERPVEVIDRDAIGRSNVHRAVLGERVGCRYAMYCIKVGEVGDWTEQALDVAGVKESAQEARHFLVTHRGQPIRVLLDVEQRDDLVDGENAEPHKYAEDGKHAVGDDKVTA